VTSPAARNALSTRALNRAVLARQGLLERSDGDIPGLLQTMAFLQAQYAPSMYIGIWSRLAGFERVELTRALEERRVVQGTLLRSTIHLVAAKDYWPVALAIRDARRVWYERVTKGDPSPAALQAAAERLRAVLRERGTVTQRELDEVVGRDLRGGVGLWLDLVRVPPAGTWERRRANLYAAAEDWLGPPPAELMADPQGCIDMLVRRYLTGFGPAAPTSVADWAGLPVATVRTALEGLGLRRFRRADGAEFIDLPDLPLPDPDTPAPVRYLPTWDATLLVHCRHSGVLPETYRPVIFTSKAPHSYGTFLVDGSVAGTWRYDAGRVVRQQLHPLATRVREELDAEGERLAELHR
jgi:hypothetical protein